MAVRAPPVREIPTRLSGSRNTGFDPIEKFFAATAGDRRLIGERLVDADTSRYRLPMTPMKLLCGAGVRCLGWKLTPEGHRSVATTLCDPNGY